MIGGSALAGRSGFVAVVLGMTIGQMVGKVLIYLAGAGAIRMPLRESHWERLGIARERLERSRIGTVPFLFVSAATGWPPFYFVSLLAGVLRLGLGTFVVPGFLGRLVRFGVIAAFPHLLTG